ncbi:Seven TM Receptor [Caenorhabditis elegans]|uniref:Seven TM Receptor n=1 Tax=Caenorhabditis elegans TaxID=6239 RepID=Q9XUN2_CAEEL|nr:Seven TM Receptor [Caenorhabditis elegans]CAB04851.1 Seven TM Receptor [Caenorhabditis elegans]|eukprot:NP_507737.1 Seven TM Receptor [Caenorhabditis elegans]
MTVLKGSVWIALTSFIDLAALSFSIPVNLLLLYCICTKSEKSFGRYKHLMAWFSMQSIFFTIIASVTHMCFHTIGGTFMMFTISNHLNLPSWGIWASLGLCCVSVGYVLLILSAQFVFRYFAMHNKKNLKYFFGWRLLYFVFSMLIVAVVYGGCGFVGINLTAEKDKSIRESMALVYEVPAEQVYYVAVEYFVRNEKNERVLNYLSIGTALTLNSVFGAMVIVIIYCGVKTYKVTHKTTSHLSSHMYIQKQLFTALLVQTLTPTALIFVPCAIFYVLPLFELPLDADANILSISLVLYPMIDPIGVLFIIKPYRNFLKKLFCHRLVRQNRCSTIEMNVSSISSRKKEKKGGSSDETSPRFDSIQN